MLAACVAALITAWTAWLGGRPFDRRVSLTSRVFARLLDLQVVLGLVLYGLSPFVRMGLGDLAAAMAVRELRFFSVEHITGMIVAIALVQVGSGRVRRASTDAAKVRHAAAWQTLAALVILVSIPWWRPLIRL